MGKTSIEWTDRTWNPTRGCSRVSQGCVHCYAERIAARFSTHSHQDGDEAGGVFAGFATKVNGHASWTGKVELIESKLLEPLSWKKPARVFVNSMSDLFHEALPDEAIDRVFAVMALCPQHTFQILTKRPDRMLKWFRLPGVQASAGIWKREIAYADIRYGDPWPLPNVWLGVSCENQETADERIPLLLQTPAAKRFVSYEPALGPVNFIHYLGCRCPECGTHYAKSGWSDCTDGSCDGRPRKLLDQVIIGGESGPGARPFQAEWARNTIEQCKAAGVAAFVKQFGASAWQGGADGTLRTRMPFKDKKGGDMDEWPEWARVREFPC